MLKKIFLPAIVLLMVACTGSQDVDQFNASPKHWRQFAATVPSLEVSPDTFPGGLAAYYPIPGGQPDLDPAKRHAVKPMFLPPRV